MSERIEAVIVRANDADFFFLDELLQGAAPVGLNTGDSSTAQPLDEAGRKAQIANAQTIIANSCL